MKTVGIRLPIFIWNILDRLAKRKGITTEHLIRTIIDEFFSLKDGDVLVEFGFHRRTMKVHDNTYWNLVKVKEETNLNLTEVVNLIVLGWLMGVW